MNKAFPGGSAVKNPPTMQEMLVPSLGGGRSPGGGHGNYSSILAWRISWSEEPSGLQSIGPRRVLTRRKQLSMHARMNKNSRH